MSNATIQIPVDLTNPGQFFACCGLLELADRLWATPNDPSFVTAWFEADTFNLDCRHSLKELLQHIAGLHIANTMTPAQLERLNELPDLIASGATSIADLEAEKKHLDGMRRKNPIVISGDVSLRIDWFCDRHTRGYALKTWAGNQSVLTYSREMHRGLVQLVPVVTDSPWIELRDIGLPFNFDSDLGAQGGGRDIGFVFDAFESSRVGQYRRGCRPILEFLCFVGLQRFRPLELTGGDYFRYAAWRLPLGLPVAAAAASTTLHAKGDRLFQFLMFNTSKDYYCFYPAIPFQGDRDE